MRTPYGRSARRARLAQRISEAGSLIVPPWYPRSIEPQSAFRCKAVRALIARSVLPHFSLWLYDASAAAIFRDGRAMMGKETLSAIVTVGAAFAGATCAQVLAHLFTMRR